MSNDINKERAYDELSIIIEQQGILQQKVSILMAINTGVLLFLISIIAMGGTSVFGIILFLTYSITPILINVAILLPYFKNGTDSKYFYDFADMDENEIEEYLSSEEGVYSQIKINSEITKKKYKLFKWSMIITFLFIPLFMYIKK